MISSADVIRKLEADGWFHVKTVGDHFQFKHPTKPGKTTVMHPTKDFGIDIIKKMERQSGVKLR